MERINKASLAQLPRLEMRLEDISTRYTETAMLGACEEDLSRVAIEVQVTDSQLCNQRRNLAAWPVSVIYLYHRLGWNSVAIAKQLGISPPLVRQFLYRLNRVSQGKTLNPHQKKRSFA